MLYSIHLNRSVLFIVKTTIRTDFIYEWGYNIFSCTMHIIICLWESYFTIINSHLIDNKNCYLMVLKIHAFAWKKLISIDRFSFRKDLFNSIVKWLGMLKNIINQIMKLTWFWQILILGSWRNRYWWRQSST